MWDVLRPWSAWRGVESGLAELAGLLRRAGAGRGEHPAADLADQAEAVLEEPLAVHAAMPAAYRVCIAPARTGQPQPEEGDLEGQLSEWLAELVRHLADVPALLEAPDSAAQLGHLLTSDLPRTWQGRLGGLTRHLRSMVRGAGAAPPQPQPAQAVKPLGRFLQAAPDGYVAVLPEETATAAAAALHAELSLALLRDLGPDCLRMHLLLLTAHNAIDRESAAEGLGLPRRGLDPREANRRLHAALERLRGVRITQLRWSAGESGAGWERTQEDLWQVTVTEYGQGYLAEQGGRLVTRGLGWSAAPDPLRSWTLHTVPPETIRSAHSLLYELEGNRNPLSLATALLLTMGDTVSHREALALGGFNPDTDAHPDPAAAWRALRAAFRLQARAGRQPDLSGWPSQAAALQDLPTWLAASTSFHPLA